MTYVSVPSPVPGVRRYHAIDDHGNLVGIVAGSGRSWDAARVGPLRSRPLVGMVRGVSRDDAVARLVAS